METFARAGWKYSTVRLTQSCNYLLKNSHGCKERNRQNVAQVLIEPFTRTVIRTTLDNLESDKNYISVSPGLVS